VSTSLAERLTTATSFDTFLDEQSGGPRWQTFASLKNEVDQLVGCDLNSAAHLTDYIERLAAHVGDPVSQGFADASRARVLHSSGKSREAHLLYESALTTFRSARLTSEAAKIRIHQVYSLTQMGRYQEALNTARAARRMCSTNEPIKLGQLETNVGNIYYMLDRYNQALKHYDRARDILSNTGDDAMLAFVDYSRSNIFVETDKPDEAEALLESAAAAWERAGRSLLAAQALYQAAHLKFLRGNYNSALNSYCQARDRVTDLGGSHIVAWCDLEIAETLLALNSFDDAAASADSAHLRFKELGMPYESAKASLTNALASMGLEDFEQARRNLIKAREVFAQSNNRTFAAQADAYLADLAIRTGDTEEAALRSAAALRVFSRQRLKIRSASSRLLAARAAYAANNPSKALRLARETLRTIGNIFAPGVTYQCEHLIGRIECDRNNRRIALECFRRAVESIERMRGGVVVDEFKASFLGDKIGVFEDAISACLDDGDPALIDEAFRLVESSKSRALADLLARYTSASFGRPKNEPDKTAENRARLSKLLEDLNWYTAQADLEDEKGDQRRAGIADVYRNRVVQRERRIARLFRRIEAEDPAFTLIQNVRTASAQDLRGALDDNELAIEYFTTGDKVSVFLVSREGLKVIRDIASKRDLEKRLAALRFQIKKFAYGSEYADAHFWQLKEMADQCLNELYKSIFAPLEALMERDRIIVMPHGPLHYVPFHALCDNRGVYLIDRFEISYAPSTAVLKLCRAKQSFAPGNKLVVLGLSEHATPGIDDELRALSSIFPDAVILAGSDATKDNLMKLAPQARFLHLASHGYFRRDNPMFSFLRLVDSQLSFYNLLDLSLNAEMVTLSACHTGVNKVFPGDELHGLMRGFLYAGAPALIVSLWAVNDRSTSQLMREVYLQIKMGKNKREALRLAQLVVKDEYGHPYYWAPFVLMGNPK